MGKGGYTGGSTFISSGSDWMRPRNELDYPTGRIGKAPTAREVLEGRISDFAREVCLCHFRGQQPPGVPDDLMEELSRTSAASLGVIPWALSRPEQEFVAREQEQELRREQYVFAVAKWIVHGGKEPSVPASLSGTTRKIIEKTKNLEIWARSQPEFKRAIKKASGSAYKDYL